MTFDEIKAMVSACEHDTSMADAFRKACGIPPRARKKHKQKRSYQSASDPDDLSHAEIEKMMTGRIGALDRA